MGKPQAADVTMVGLIDLANQARRPSRDSHAMASATDAEAWLERLFGHSERLAVYGTLAPGRSNHHVLARYGGAWSRGRVRGDLVEAGWGAAAGYPALRCRAGGPWVPVHVLESAQLPGAWPDIDAFEGSEYRRILVPVYAEHGDAPGLITVANLYEVAD
jgi:gamma-glutamylcyclotransferase (GGCT)/AIG2-like uncharacterized protein YtfP